MLGIASAMLVGGCEPGILSPAGPIAAGERTILFNSLAIMLSIVVPVIVGTLAFAWWFREGNARAKRMPDFTYSGRLELLVWSIPALIIIFLGGIAWISSHDLDPPRPIASKVRPLTVEVVSLDWKWVFIYPEQGVATINRLVVPAGTPIRFRITSGTVMNSFFVPRLGSQIYAMSGMETALNLQADQPGTYRGLSAHYSGAGFADMNFVVNSVTPAAFGQWVTRTRAAGPVLDGRAYLALAGHSSASPKVTYRAVTPGLFDATVRNGGMPVHKIASEGRQQ